MAQKRLASLPLAVRIVVPGSESSWRWDSDMSFEMVVGDCVPCVDEPGWLSGWLVERWGRERPRVLVKMVFVCLSGSFCAEKSHKRLPA